MLQQLVVLVTWCTAVKKGGSGRLLCLWWCLWCCCWLGHTVVLRVEAGRYSPFQYDKTVPQFTPDGRLLQVEYAQVASDHSTAVLCVALSSDTILLCTTAKRTTITASTTATPTAANAAAAAAASVQRSDEEYTIVGDSAEMLCTASDLGSIRQERLVLLQPSSSRSLMAHNNHQHHYDEASLTSSSSSSSPPVAATNTRTPRRSSSTGSVVVVALSGILADSLSLLDRVREERVYQRQWYGASSALSAQQVVKTLANAAHQHAFGGGLRPYGSTMLVCGIHNHHNNNNNQVDDKENDLMKENIANAISIYKTDPSGGIQEYRLAWDQGVQNGFLLVGGGLLAPTHDLRQRILSEWSTWQSGSSLSTRQRLARILTLVDNVQNQRSDHTTQTQDDRTPTTTTTTTGPTRKATTPDQNYRLEAVLMSTSKGVIKLSDQDILLLLQQSER